MILNIPEKVIEDLEVIIKYQNSVLIHLIGEEYKENEKCQVKNLIRKFVVNRK